MSRICKRKIQRAEDSDVEVKDGGDYGRERVGPYRKHRIGQRKGKRD